MNYVIIDEMGKVRQQGETSNVQRLRSNLNPELFLIVLTESISLEKKYYFDGHFIDRPKMPLEYSSAPVFLGENYIIKGVPEDTDITSPQVKCTLTDAGLSCVSDSVGDYKVKLVKWPYLDERIVIQVVPSTESELRTKRDALLVATDWTQLPDVPEEVRLRYVVYRQALRDITLQEGAPDDVIWPTPPES